MKINHFIGATLLVSGTTIGAGMLALPVMTSFSGFFPSLLVFGVCWIFMLATAYFFLDVNCAIEGEVNLVSMAQRTLGMWGKVVSWIIYLLLLYSLIAAYIAAGTPLIQIYIRTITGYHLPLWIAHFSLPLLLGGAIYLGIVGVDVINRFLMLGLSISYLLLISFLPHYMHEDLLFHVDWPPTLIAIPVVITSFGYHIIIPSLTTYMHHNKKHLRWTLFIGSIIPLFIYIIWELVTLGTVPIEGKVSLFEAWKHGFSVTHPLSQIVQSNWIKMGTHFFLFFAIVTSFLGVSLSLSDFLTDGFKLKKTWEGRLIAIFLTFIPPLVFLFIYDRGFIIALEYGAVFIAILLIFLPTIMAWHIDEPKFYKTTVGRVLLIIVMLFALFIIVIDVLEQLGYFKSLISKYVTI